MLLALTKLDPAGAEYSKQRFIITLATARTRLSQRAAVAAGGGGGVGGVAMVERHGAAAAAARDPTREQLRRLGKARLLEVRDWVKCNAT